MDVKQVIVIRKDLNMRKGKMIAQGAHASMAVFFNQFLEVTLDGAEEGSESGLQEGDRCLLMGPSDAWDWKGEVLPWIEGAFTKIVLGIDSEEELISLIERADMAKLPHAAIKDSGKTEFKGVPTLTAVAIGPAKAKAIDKLTGHLKLL